MTRWLFQWNKVTRFPNGERICPNHMTLTTERSLSRVAKMIIVHVVFSLIMMRGGASTK